jgi:hypothetical protein
MDKEKCNKKVEKNKPKIDSLMNAAEKELEKINKINEKTFT